MRIIRGNRMFKIAAMTSLKVWYREALKPTLIIIWLTISFPIRYKLVYLKEPETVFKVYLFRLSFIFRKAGKIANRAMFFKQEEIYVTVFGLHSNRQWNFLTLEVTCSTPNCPPAQPVSGLCLMNILKERTALCLDMCSNDPPPPSVFVPFSISPFVPLPPSLLHRCFHCECKLKLPEGNTKLLEDFVQY